MQPEWEFWLDNHFSPIIAKWINDQTKYVCKSSYILQLEAQPDIALYKKAKQAGNIILISKDSDLPQLISLYGSPPKLINIRRGNCANKIMFHLISSNLDKAYRMLTQFNYDIIELA